MRALSARELGRLLAAAESSKRDTAILNLLARAGLRVGEVVHLRLKDLELKGRSGWVVVKSGKLFAFRDDSRALPAPDC